MLNCFYFHDLDNIMEYNDFFQHIKATNAKLKKRFLKKPNVAEASEDFGNLSRQLQQKGCAQYAGYCCMAKAKCDETMLYHNQEIESLLEAARCFKAANTDLEESSCPNFREHLINAEDLYSQAIKKLSIQKKNPRAASVCYEFADYLFNLGRYSEALQYYNECINLISEVPLIEIKTRNQVIHCQIMLKDYVCALKSGIDLLDFINNHICHHTDQKTPMGAFKQCIFDCEVTSLLLILKINQHKDYMHKPHRQLLEKYTMDFSETSDVNKHEIPDNLTLTLQAYVDAFYDDNKQDLKIYASQLRSQLTLLQSFLLDLLES